MKNCSTSPAIRETQIKRLAYHLTAQRMTIIKKARNQIRANADENVVKRRSCTLLVGM